ncbi:hypothetical protein PZ938_00200 [Luteipulveratus sp. YIM 133132]|uniref:SCO6880 family protein n=1 Tax=Luteipulveratus flavus TaxID=3031728 RepID=UPI0023B0FE93|nr:SCO6880 family protein [Luteipulveratus sp. YIM 133132]MDE9364015.1 hypothetical protein [Luteipulveratus sp. YIM 133132]
MSRQVILGGEYRRQLVERGRVRPEFVGLAIHGAIAVVIGLLVAPVSYPAAVVTWATGGGLGLLVFLPRRSLGGHSKASLWAGALRWRRRQRRGLHVFSPGEPARRKGRPTGKSTTRARVAPDWLGEVRRVSVRMSSDSTDSVLVLLHKGQPGGLGYATVALEVETGAGTHDEDYAAFGRFKAVLAQDDSLVGGLQQHERITPASAQRHRRWVRANRAANVPEVLVRSYDNLLLTAEAIGERHRSLLTLRVPFTDTFLQQVRDTYGHVDSATRAQLVVLEAQRAAGLGMAHARYRAVRPLSETQLGAMIAGTFDPSVEEDDDRFTLENCWPHYEAGRRSVKVTSPGGNTCLIRTARIERADLPGTPIAVNRLQNLLVGIYPAVTRTVSVLEELTPAWIAKQHALESQTVDRSRLRKSATTVTDGSEEDQANASQQRLTDLRQGQGHQGVGFGLHVMVQATTEVELTRAVQRVEAVANEFTRLRWLDTEQDLALVHSLPLGKGLDMRPRK